MRGVPAEGAGTSAARAAVPLAEELLGLPPGRALQTALPGGAVVKPSPVTPGVWVRVRPSPKAASHFSGAVGLVCSLDREKRAAMVLLVGERKPLSFGVRELELATRGKP